MSRHAAINATTVPVADYAPDPRGWGLAAALAAAGAGALNGARAVVAGPQYLGWVQNPQRMTGAAAAVANARARVIAPNTSTLSQQKTTTDVTTQAVFRSRMARGQR